MDKKEDEKEREERKKKDNTNAKGPNVVYTCMCGKRATSPGPCSCGGWLS